MKKTVSKSNGACGQTHTRISLESSYSKDELKVPTEKHTADTFGEQFDGELSNDSEDDTDCNDLFEGKTPVQRVCIKYGEKIQKKQVLITKLREKEKDISERINRVKSNQMDWKHL